MKTIKKGNMFFLTLLTSVFLISCSEDEIIDVDPIPPSTNNELSGKISKDLTLDPAVEYKLTGTFTVETGNTLTIPAGTHIMVERGTENYIVIEKGADIEVLGTQSNPVLMASKDGNPGDWGGLVILGNATTTAGVNATAEVGQLIYGGTDDSDDSGSINYLVIKGAGAQINAESQYNGLSLYAVGSGTSIQNVAMLNGADDGVEFFGGTVSATNLYLENNEDDAVDWTEGWNGSITNTYVLHTIDGFSTAVEADGINANPKIINFTAISTTGGTALQFKKESGATITGLSLSGYDTTIDMKDGGTLTNVQIGGEAANLNGNYAAEATVDINSFDWVN
ncbi:MAG TPA: hypothetical protein VFM59_07450 [Salinimicrobium sp.]|nr:hypothetical protein [Salinimicrobium sp.]